MPVLLPRLHKKVRTDADGFFKLTGLSSKLLFRLAVGSKEHQGTVTDHHDPMHADPQQSPLAKITLRQLPDDDQVRRVEGRIVDLSGKPIAGAEIRSHLVLRGSSFSSASDPAVTPLTVSDEGGRFVTTIDVKVTRVNWRINAAGYASHETEWSVGNNEPLSIELGRGASIRGQLLFDGKPISGAPLGTVQENRMMGNIVTPQEVSTDEDGFFQFDSLPPNRDYTIYTLMDQPIKGVLPVSLIAAPAHGQLVDLGSIETEPAQTLTVTLETTDGSPLPAGSILSVGRNLAWQTSQFPFGGDGNSSCKRSLPAVGDEMVEISAKVRGFVVDSTEPPLPTDLNQRYPLRIADANSLTVRLAPKP